MSKIKTQSQLEQTLQKCQKRLRLSDWDISIKFVSACHMENANAVAECRFSEQDMEATIRVLNPTQNNYPGKTGQHIESSIYHELLHILITPNLSKDCPNVHEEQLIERIAKALVGV